MDPMIWQAFFSCPLICPFLSLICLSVPYCAAKFAVKGYTETLYQELRDTSIRVSCVHPGGIRTNIAKNARVKNSLYNISKETAAEVYDKEVFITTADDAAKIIIQGIKKNERRIMVGRDAKILDLLTRLFPKTLVFLSAIVSKRTAKKYAGSKKMGVV